MSNSDLPDSLLLVQNRIGIWCVPNCRLAPINQPRLEGATMSDSNPSGLSDNAAAGIAYITLIPAIVFLILDPFKKSTYVRFHAWQSIFLFVAWAVVFILAGVVQNFVPAVLFLTLTLWQLIDLAFFLILIIVFVNAFNGKRILLPIVGGLAEKQAKS
jgi:uncharacterized membrane protein